MFLYAAESLFVDWGTDSGDSGKGDIYIITKDEIDTCNDGVGRIPVSVHKNVPPGKASKVYSMPSVMRDPPPQGPGITC